MFPTLPSLPKLDLSRRPLPTFVEQGGGGGDFGGFNFGDLFSGGGFGDGGGGGLNPIVINAPIGGSSGGLDGIIGGVGRGILGATSGGLSSVLGIPNINWGRIAAFLLGLLLIAGGLYLIKPVQQQIKVVVGHAKNAAKTVAEATE